jgi:glutamyl-tRNA synthetase
MSNRPVRVRFAPSPTGPLHIGGMRTALFNYLFARKHQGKFILRIEDTDQVRSVENAVEYIIKSLAWCGIEIDEGVTVGGPHSPYRQSERKEIYQQYALKLIETGYAYYAYDNPEELEGLRREAEQNKKTFTYNQQVRDGLKNSVGLPPAEVEELNASGTPRVIRFKMPEDQLVVVNDIVRGKVEVNTTTLDDKILLKADDMPTYHLANVVDDYLMEISHVIRGEEWLPSTPLHVLLYSAFGWKDSMPLFAHMPLTLKPDGKGKLSKRDGDRLGFPVFPMQWTNPENGELSKGYRESGYLPEAFLNILAFLGWNPGTEKEIFSLDELIEAFSLDRIVKAGSRFDPEKAKWFNHQYLMQKSAEELAESLENQLKENEIQSPRPYNIKVIGLVRERAVLLPDLWEQSRFFYESPEVFDEKVAMKVWKDNTPDLIGEINNLLDSLDPFTASTIEPAIKEYVNSREIGFGNIMNPLRLALTGSNMGPGLMDMMEVIGKEETLKRINTALEKLK